MYDFIYSEVWWMETIIAATITGICAVLAGYLVYHGKLTKIEDKCDDIDTTVEDLSKGHYALSQEHHNISSKIDLKSQEFLNSTSALRKTAEETKLTVEKIREDAIKEKKTQEDLFNGLSKSGKELNDFISTGINSINALQLDYLKLNEANIKQEATIKKLNEEFSKLQEQSKNLSNERIEINYELKKILKENEQLVADYNKLATKYTNLQNRKSQAPSQSLRPTIEYDR